jgi:hypothetical protein
MTDKPSLLTRRRVLVAAVAFLFSWYAGSYWRGMTKASIDHACGHYEIKAWGFPAGWRGDYMRLLSERYAVEEDVVGGCMVFPTTEWYADGYNSVSRPLLLKKYGKDIFAECAAQAKRQWQAEHPGEW